MINLKSLFGILAGLMLVAVLASLGRFAMDLWKYFHTSGTANEHLNYRGVTGALIGLCFCAVFLVLHLVKKD